MTASKALICYFSAPFFISRGIWRHKRQVCLWSHCWVSCLAYRELPHPVLQLVWWPRNFWGKYVLLLLDVSMDKRYKDLFIFQSLKDLNLLLRQFSTLIASHNSSTLDEFNSLAIWPQFVDDKYISAWFVHTCQEREKGSLIEACLFYNFFSFIG